MLQYAGSEGAGSKALVVLIRESNAQENDAIRAVHLVAFGPQEGPAVAQFAVDLLADPSAEPELSLAAENAGGLLGSVICSAVTIGGHPRAALSILCPLAVVPARHGQGIGAALVNCGIALLRERGVDIVLVLGDPRYYRRFGFAADHRLEPPYPVPYREAWRALELNPGALASVAGTVRCADSLHDPHHW